MSSSDQPETPPEVTSKDENDSSDSDEEAYKLNDIVGMMDDIVEDHKQASRLLGGSDENYCSYIEGAITQPLYACRTCEMKIGPDGEKVMAGFCLACSNQCHDGHEVIELYHKRDFCCDCGNDKFLNNKCKLFHKVGENTENKYNHNFLGLYCTCNRPYPDDNPDLENPEMIQCSICEDWFHPKHIDKESPSPYHTDVFCKSCVTNNPFLIYYEKAGCFDTEDKEEQLWDNLDFPQFQAYIEKRYNESITENCKLVEYKKKYKEKHGTEKIDESMFVPLYVGFKSRFELCKCSSCLDMYGSLKIPYIIDPKDMIFYRDKKNYYNDLQNKIKLTPFQERIVKQGTNQLKEMIANFLKEMPKKVGKICLADVEDLVRQIKRKTEENSECGVKYVCR